ncbi:hypothetical protein MTP99_009260 [Tenebrio molitor]|nr:hypothetical protein MTP99_009260 [Tenebrio molitor]
MILILEIFVSFLVISILLLWFRLKSKNKDFYKSISGPPPVPIFGNVLDFSSTTTFIDVMLKYVKSMEEYSYCTVDQSSDDYHFFRPWLGTGLLTSDGPKWRKHRKITTPAFHFQILEQFLDVFESSGNTLIKKLEKEVGKKSFDIYPFITLCTLDVICESAMGTKINAQENSESEYVRSVKKLCAP